MTRTVSTKKSKLAVGFVVVMVNSVMGSSVVEEREKSAKPAVSLSAGMLRKVWEATGVTPEKAVSR